MLASATGSSKSINYMLSFLSIFAGVMCVHKLTELPPGFAHITTESELLLAMGQSSTSSPNANNTASSQPPDGLASNHKTPLPPSSPSPSPLRRRCAGRVATAVDASQDVWAVAAAYHSSLYRRWVETGAGFLLAECCATLRSKRTRNNSSAAAEVDNSNGSNNRKISTSIKWLSAARNMLGLDDCRRRGGRILGLACRQLPLPVVEPSSSKCSSKNSGGGGRSMAPLPPPWITVPKTSLNSANIHGSALEPNAKSSSSSSSSSSSQGPAAPQHGGLDESLVGAGFALYYSTGAVPDNPSASSSLSAERPLSLTLAYVAPTEAAVAAATRRIAAEKSEHGASKSGTVQNVQKKKEKAGSSSHGRSPTPVSNDRALPSEGERAHAAAVLYRVMKCLVREAAEENKEEEEAGTAAGGTALSGDVGVENKKHK